MKSVILDIDGTLVDTNYHHALAWFRAFRENRIVLALWRIHRHIGMGGDQLVAALAGDDVERERGDEIRSCESREYGKLIEDVAVMAGARALLEDLARARTRAVLASSAKPHEVDRYLDLLDARELVDAWTTAGDVEQTKPAPDLVHAALERLGADPGDALMVGDSPWDMHAARRAGVACVGVLTGGFAIEELRESGASRVFEDLGQLRRAIADGLLEGPVGPARA